MKKLLIAGVACAALTAQGASYELSVDVGYGFGGTSTSGLYSGDPDTGFVVVKNTGASAFTGTMTVGGTSPFTWGGWPYPYIDTFTGTLGVGASWTLLPGPESSNVGGFNGPFGVEQPGALFTVHGLADSLAVDFEIYDKDIHSGVPRTNPFGVTLDNYILQGGDPIGRDTGDDYEVTQAHAFFKIAGSSSVPDSGTSMMLLGSGLSGLALLRRKLNS